MCIAVDVMNVVMPANRTRRTKRTAPETSLEARPIEAQSSEQSALAVGFNEVFAAEHRALVALALSLTGSMAAAEDLTQEAFLRLHQQWSRVATYDRPGVWLRRVLLNLATSRARRLGAEARAILRLSRERSRQPSFLSSESTEFWSAVRGLPRRQAQILALYYAEDRPVPDVAEILGLAEGTVRAHLHQGRQALRARLKLDDEQEGVR